MQLRVPVSRDLGLRPVDRRFPVPPVVLSSVPQMSAQEGGGNINNISGLLKTHSRAAEISRHPQFVATVGRLCLVTHRFFSPFGKEKKPAAVCLARSPWKLGLSSQSAGVDKKKSAIVHFDSPVSSCPVSLPQMLPHFSTPHSRKLGTTSIFSVCCIKQFPSFNIFIANMY